MSPRISLSSSRDTGTVVYLYPGDIHIDSGEVVLRTVLGSCVSVCLWDERTSIGGMNHFLLARTPLSGGPPGRYGDTATKILIEGLVEMGAAKRRLKAKVFGGAGVLGGAGRMGQLGLENADAAFAALNAAGIPVTTKDVGGPWGRRLILRLQDGTTSCVRLKHTRRG